MRLLAFSDWRVHSIPNLVQYVRRLNPPVDFILYAGDDVGRFQERGVNSFSELAKLTRQHRVLAVIGNDDTPAVRRVLAAEGVHDLHRAPFTFHEYGFLGLEASTTGPAVVQHPERAVAIHLARQHKTLGAKKLIVLSHAPPFGVLDRGIRFAAREGSPHHIGSTALKAFVDRTRPRLVLCGHCHSQGRRAEQLEDTLIMNVASHDDPRIYGCFAILEIGNRIEHEWHNTLELEGPWALRTVHGIGLGRQSRLVRAGITTVVELAEMPDVARVAAMSGLSQAILNTTANLFGRQTRWPHVP